MDRRRLVIMAASLLAASPAAAQINPFQSSRREPGLSDDDLDMFLSSVNRLNRTPNVAVGTTTSWNNPATGSHGTSTLERIFRKDGMTCHLLHHAVFPHGRTPANPYELTWCLTPQGEWKILK